MKRIDTAWMIATAALVVSAFGCGGASGGKSYSCDVVASGQHSCTEYDWSGGDVSTANYASACMTAGGTAGTSCTQTGAIGGCSIDASSGSVHVATVSWYYAGTPSSLMAACAAASGTWITPGTKPGGDGADMAGVNACVAHTVMCTDEAVQQLVLYDTVNMATIGNAPTGADFMSSIDATGGGLSPTKSFVYAKFTATGLTRVDVSDEAAFTSSDWDIAFRRFVIRVNSGISGPSCVTAARTANGTAYATLTTTPPSLDYRDEQYFTATCDYVPDGSGLGSPGTALQSFWMYQSCVQMTNNVFILQLSDGRHVKLVVVDYYAPAVQDKCNTDGDMPSGASGAGNIVVQWAFLP